MSEDTFETDLERMFAATPAFDDQEAFVARVGAAAERLRRVQRWIYGSAIVAGGAVAALQLAQWREFVPTLAAVGERLLGVTAFAEPGPMAAWLVTGGVLLTAYVVQLLREEA
jgi:hypothetical protein